VQAGGDDCEHDAVYAADPKASRVVGAAGRCQRARAGLWQRGFSKRAVHVATGCPAFEHRGKFKGKETVLRETADMTRAVA